MLSMLFKALLLLNFVAKASSEVKIFESTLAATSGSVHFSTSYLIDPGSVDLTFVKFIAGAPSSLLLNEQRYSGDDTTGDDGEEDDDEVYYEDDIEEELEEELEEEIEELLGEEVDVDDADAGDDDAYYEDDETAEDDIELEIEEELEEAGEIINEEEDSAAVTDDADTGDDDAYYEDDETAEDDIELEIEEELEEAGEIIKEEEDSAAVTDDADAGDDAYYEDDEAAEDDIELEIEEELEEAGEIIKEEEDSAAVTDDADAGDDDAYYEDDEVAEDDDFEEILEEIEEALEEEEGGGGDRSRHLAQTEYTVDVLFFHEPSDCAKTKEGCEWTELGVGNSDGQGNIRWCCSDESIAMGLCEAKDSGRVIINKDLFKGEHRFVNIPATGDFVGNLTYPLFTTNQGSGQYTLLLSNCNDYGRDVQLDGLSIWQSKGGYLPGDRFDEWQFVMFMMLSYAILFGWYGLNMKRYRDSRIGIQSWILGTIFLCLLHAFLKTTDFVLWNREGFRSDPALYASVTVGVIKGAISRCLLIMVSLGWGVIRDSLGDQMKKIVLLGLVYLFTAFCRDISERVFIEEVHILSVDEEAAIYDFFTLFTLVTAAIDVVCYMWILDALNGTMQHLENMNQAMKLKQYLRLRLILLLSILFALFWTVLGVVNTTMDTAILSENQDWIIPAAWSVNYFGILFSIAMLWRPNPRAKDFAYVMELPSSVGEDLDFETNVIGSPDDDDDETGIHQSYSGGYSNLKVDNGVST